MGKMKAVNDLQPPWSPALAFDQSLQHKLDRRPGLVDGYGLTHDKDKRVGGISEDHLDMRVRQEWAPILPKDREQFINELTNRVSVNLGSLEHLLEMTGDVEDVDDLVVQFRTQPIIYIPLINWTDMS